MLFIDADDPHMVNYTLNVVIPDSFRTFVNERMRSGDYADEGEYLCDLLRRDREIHSAERLRALIEAGLASGQPRAISDADWTQ